MKRWTNGLPGATKRLGANLALRGLSVSQSGCARIPMMARSKIAPLQRPNTLMQLSRSSVLELPLATRGRAIHNGTIHRTVIGRAPDDAIGEPAHSAVPELGGGSPPHQYRRDGGLAQLPADFGMGGLHRSRPRPLRQGQDREPDGPRPRRSRWRQGRRIAPEIGRAARSAAGARPAPTAHPVAGLGLRVGRAVWLNARKLGSAPGKSRLTRADGTRNAPQSSRGGKNLLSAGYAAAPAISSPKPYSLLSRRPILHNRKMFFSELNRLKPLFLHRNISKLPPTFEGFRG